ncbi:hypothetical protein JCM21900_005378 [Sporobolomyces salmonicolor]
MASKVRSRTPDPAIATEECPTATYFAPQRINLDLNLCGTWGSATSSQSMLLYAGVSKRVVRRNHWRVRNLRASDTLEPLAETALEATCQWTATLASFPPSASHHRTRSAPSYQPAPLGNKSTDLCRTTIHPHSRPSLVEGALQKHLRISTATTEVLKSCRQGVRAAVRGAAAGPATK